MSRIIDYLLDRERRAVFAVVALALLIGVGAGFFLSRPQGPQSTKPDAPIEWNKVQSLPKATHDVEDNEWQERADSLDEPRTAARNRTGAAAGNTDD